MSSEECVSASRGFAYIVSWNRLLQSETNQIGLYSLVWSHTCCELGKLSPISKLYFRTDAGTILATNKNQHFVPRCYLRPFTIDGANSAINLFNVDREIFVKGAAVKHQCSKNYFYGEDPSLEHVLQMTEGVYASVLRALQVPGYVLTEDHRLTLLRFWLLQHMRTEAASRRAVENSHAVQEVLEAGHDMPDSAFDYSFGIRDAVLVAMRAFADNIEMVDDLKVCLVRNRSAVPFFTSDDPAVMTNRWHLSGRGSRGCAFGMGSAGTLAILPLTPELLCLGYDGGVYSVAHRAHWIDIRDDDDARAFNVHQVMNCYANLYVREVGHEQIVRDAHTEAAGLRRGGKFQINYAVLEHGDADSKRYVVVDPQEAGEHTEAIIHLEEIHIDPRIWPRVVRRRNRGNVYTDGSGQGYIRRARAAEERPGRYLRERPW